MICVKIDIFTHIFTQSKFWALLYKLKSCRFCSNFQMLFFLQKLFTGLREYGQMALKQKGNFNKKY